MTAVLPERATAPVAHPADCPCETCAAAGTGAADLMARPWSPGTGR